MPWTKQLSGGFFLAMAWVSLPLAVVVQTLTASPPGTPAWTMARILTVLPTGGVLIFAGIFAGLAATRGNRIVLAAAGVVLVFIVILAMTLVFPLAQA